MLPNKLSLMAVTVGLVALGVAHGATEFHVPQVRLPLLKTPPVIDGEVHEDEWAGAARMERFGWAGTLSPQEASFWVGSDGKELFVAVVSETPPGGKILQGTMPLPEGGNVRPLSDDEVELVFDPLRSDTTGRRRIYHAILNARGAIYDQAYLPNGTGEAWRGHWRMASKIIGDRWHFEVAIPLADMKVTAADLSQPFGVRVGRNWQQQHVGPFQTEWGAIPGACLNPDTIPVVTWDEHAPVVQVLQIHDPNSLAFHTRVALHNPHGAPLEVQVALQCTPKSSAPTSLNRSVKIAPNGTETVDLGSGAVAGEEVFTSIRVASPDDRTVYYLRDFNWKLARPEPLWALEQERPKQADVKFAYYPYHNTIKTVVNVSALAERDKVSGVKLSVRPQFGVPPSDGTARAIIATTHLPALKDYAAEMEWKIPPLPEGRYEFVAEFTGVKTAPVVQEFVRHVFVWEHNKLGKSDVVIEPFTPIQVEGQTVSTVLRAHQLTNLGLFAQVESLGRPLLKAPMRLEVNGVEVSGQRLRFVQRQPTRVVTEAKWSAGKLTGSARGEWDYDGMLKWTLVIQPAAESVNSMTLVIPLQDRRMPLFHECTDGLRFNYVGATPAGQGRVWDGSKATRNSIIGSYVPYIWLGAEERGLAVFGENDRGWGRDPKVPYQEIVRRGETLELRLNLIAAPTKIEQPRQIVIGFQATPTKPMPDGWRTWQMAGGAGADKGVEMNWSWLGACYYWGGLSMAADLYPRNRDFSIYDKLAETRRTGKIDQEFIKHWLDGYPPFTHIAASNEWQASFEGLYVPHVNAGFGVAQQARPPVRMIAYTNTRGAFFDEPEGETFVDEWQRDAFNPHVRASYYDLNTVESFRDFALWCYQKMLTTWLDDVYWDNIFLVSCFDTVGTDAYELPSGVIQPACGLFNTRELFRRTAVLDHELHHRGFNQAHMTNTAIVPVLSFCSTQLAWEDRQGDADFQDRFSRDYIRAETIGRQSGNVPFTCALINGGTDEAKNQWVLRTYAGVLLTHEVKPRSSAAAYHAYWDNFLRLLEFGYGKPDVRVWNYWDADYPVHIEGSETSSLVVSKPGRAIIVVCDYGSGGNLRLKPEATLGLGDKFTAKDLESGQPLTVAGNTVEFALKKHDFKIVCVETAR